MVVKVIKSVGDAGVVKGFVSNLATADSAFWGQQQADPTLATDAACWDQQRADLTLAVEYDLSISNAGYLIPFQHKPHYNKTDLLPNLCPTKY